MTAAPVLILLAAAVGLGAVNLALRLRGARKSVLIGVHLLLGIGALEVLVFFLKDANGGDGLPAGPWGNVAAGLLGAAVFIGLISPILGKNSKPLSNLLLVAHVGCGLAGAVTAAAWVNWL